MDFALMTEPQLGGTYEEQLAAARWAEQAGLTSFARSDHYYSSRQPPPEATDAFSVLAGLARETSHIRLCVLVSPITFRHPAVLAKMAATIDQMSGGRLDLGVGTGWMDLEHDAFGLPFPAWSERFGRLEEALLYLKAAFSEGKQTFAGRYYELEADVRPGPTTSIPIIVGGQGPNRTPRLAGTYADEYNHFIAQPADIAPKIERVRKAAERAGPRPGSDHHERDGTGAGRGRRRPLPREARNGRRHRNDEPDELERRWDSHGIPLGPPSRVAETLAGLAAAGVTKFYVQHLDLSDLSTLDQTFEVLRFVSCST